MNTTNALKVVALAMSLHASAVSALGSDPARFISAPRRVDMVYDSKRDTIYISSGGEILRYHVADNRFLAPITVGGSARGIDLSGNGDVLAVADADNTDHLWVHLIDLPSLSVTKLEAPKEPYYAEAGTWAVNYAYDGSLFVGSSFYGSGPVFLRRFRFGHDRLGPTTTMDVVDSHAAQDTMVSASGDGRVIAYVGSNNSDGPWGVFNEQNRELVQSNSSHSQNFEIVSNANGTQFAMPSGGAINIYDGNLQKVASFGSDISGGGPMGAVYAPVDHLAYFPWAGTREIRVYDMDVIAHVGSYLVGAKASRIPFRADYPRPFYWARTRISRDGSLLMVAVPDGLEALRMYAPLSARSLQAMTFEQTSLQIRLMGAIGNNGSIRYEIDQPKHGTATVSGDTVSYSPPPGYVGGDSFSYRAVYGRASAEAVVHIDVK